MELNQLYTLTSAILGFVTAIINRKRIVELKYNSNSSSTPVTIKKRFKRMTMLIVAGFIALAIAATLKLSPSVAGITLGFFTVLILYQFLAMLILMWATLWR